MSIEGLQYLTVVFRVESTSEAANLAGYMSGDIRRVVGMRRQQSFDESKGWNDKERTLRELGWRRQ